MRKRRRWEWWLCYYPLYLVQTNPTMPCKHLVLGFPHTSCREGKWWNPANHKWTKAPKKGGTQGTKWKDPCPRRQKNHLRGQTTRGTSSSRTQSVLVTTSISNKEREGPCLKEPSPTATAHLGKAKGQGHYTRLLQALRLVMASPLCFILHLRAR